LASRAFRSKQTKSQFQEQALKQAIVATLARPLAGVGLPLKQRTFRRIWLSSLLSNLGQQVLAVAAAWTMLQLTHAADLVAMVQTASMLPIMLLAVPAGAIADMYDRRKVAMGALTLSLSGAALLALLAAWGLIAPHLILMCCFIVGTGVALYSPAWQASAAEVVGIEALPAAVALYSLSSNVARSVGPAIGGIIVATAGMVPAFSTNALLYVPILIALFLWKRLPATSRLPPERLDRAMISGLRYVRHAPPIRRVLARTVLTALGGAANYSMMPLIAGEMLGGGPGTFGFLLGSFGVGAVVAALNVDMIRRKVAPDLAISVCAATIGAALLIASVSPFVIMTAAAMSCAGASWMISISLFNVAVQLSAPRWVGGRALATFQSATAGGLASGAWLWGHIAHAYGVQAALGAAGAIMITTPLASRWLPMPRRETMADGTLLEVGEPGLVKLELTGRSGPVIIEIQYEIDPAQAREFYHVIRKVQRSRERNGAFNVSIARDVTTPEIWIERFQYPTWNDYLRARNRLTVSDRELRDRSLACHIGERPPIMRRLLERPFGSVRWRDDAPDHGVLPITLSSSAGG
jgi:MFS family permease